MNRVDLHVHSSFSDGALTPAEILRVACCAGLKVISITDHDEVRGFRLGIQQSKDFGLDLVPGIEISSRWQGYNVHILGYYIDVDNEHLSSLLGQLRLVRQHRVRRVVGRLQELGVGVGLHRVVELAGPGVISKVHVARAMVELGEVATVRDAFARFLGTDGPAHVGGGFEISPRRAIQTVRQAGGIPVLAHPILPQSERNLPLKKFLPMAISVGLQGLEAYYPGYTRQISASVSQLAERYGLIVTGGSDFHGGGVLPEVWLGSVHVPEVTVTRLKCLAEANASQVPTS